MLLQQLEKDTEAVNEVRNIVEHEEGIMKKETQIVYILHVYICRIPRCYYSN